MRYAAILLVNALISCSSSGTNHHPSNPSDSIPLVLDTPELDEKLALDSIHFRINADTLHTYKEALAHLQTRRNSWLLSYRSSTSNLAKDSILIMAGLDLENTLVQSLFPFWYGTAWDFNGISNVPGEGQIACGYFVSTTLKHSGCNLNRYKVAQQSSKKACEIFALGDSVRRYAPADIEDFKSKNAHLEDGLYCIGLDYHVGYLLKRDDHYFFIHSSYVGIDGVSIEPIEEAQAFYSQVYYLSAITNNTQFVKRWIEGGLMDYR